MASTATCFALKNGRVSYTRVVRRASGPRQARPILARDGADEAMRERGSVTSDRTAYRLDSALDDLDRLDTAEVFGIVRDTASPSPDSPVASLLRPRCRGKEHTRTAEQST